jgi:hypothetical protein
MAKPRMERMEKQLSNIQTLIEGMMKQNIETAKIVAENSKEMTEINKWISKGEKFVGETSTTRTRVKQNHGSNNSMTPKLAKLDFPKYKGVDNPTSWVCRVEQFFEFQRIEEGDKLPMAAYHLEGEVQIWYQLWKEGEENLDWDSLKQALHIRYGPTIFEDHFGDLTKLQQMGSI